MHMGEVMSLHPGQRVVCIKDIPVTGGYGTEKAPVKGKVYTVRDRMFSEHHRAEAIRLVEVTNIPMDYHDGFHECWFACRCFRPVHETNIDIFKAMLVTNPKRVAA